MLDFVVPVLTVLLGGYALYATAEITRWQNTTRHWHRAWQQSQASEHELACRVMELQGFKESAQFMREAGPMGPDPERGAFHQ